MQKIESMRRFAHLDLDDDRLPDESVILQFHHFLETKQLTAMLFDVLTSARLSAIGGWTESRLTRK